MKTPLITVLAFAAGTFLAVAQATISIGTTFAPYAIETNANLNYIPGVYIPTTGSPTARTATAPNSYFYEVLTTLVGANASGSAPTAAPSANPFSGDWLDTGVGGKNFTISLFSGGITSVGGPATAAGTWAEPTGSWYTNGTVQWYVIVGWSANLGNNWSTARANFLNGTGEALGALFGQSQLAGGGGPNALPIVNLWGNGTTIPGAGLTTGFTLATIVPEPSTCTLAALGTAAMVAVRR